MLPDSKVVDAPPHKISIDQTVAMANDFELLVLFTSTLGFDVDVKIAEMMKDVNPKLKVAFVGPPVTVEPRPAHLPQLAHPPSRETAARLHFLLDLLVDSGLPVGACSFRCSSTRCKHRRKKSISQAC